MDLIESGRLKRHIALRTSNRELFKINETELENIDIQSIKPEALFLFKNITLVNIRHYSKSPNEVPEYLKIFEENQFNSKMEVIGVNFTINDASFESSSSSTIEEILQPLSRFGLNRLEIYFDLEAQFEFVPNIWHLTSKPEKCPF